jgi:hypothetical protein
MFKKIILSSLVLGSLALASPADAAYIETSGTLSFLRVHDVGTGYGPPTDSIDVEVVIQFANQPGKSFGFQLRNDANRAVREAMLDILRDAYVNNYKVTIDVEIPAGKNNGVLNRVWISK